MALSGRYELLKASQADLCNHDSNPHEAFQGIPLQLALIVKTLFIRVFLFGKEKDKRKNDEQQRGI